MIGSARTRTWDVLARSSFSSVFLVVATTLAIYLAFACEGKALLVRLTPLHVATLATLGTLGLITNAALLYYNVTAG